MDIHMSATNVMVTYNSVSMAAINVNIQFPAHREETLCEKLNRLNYQYTNGYVHNPRVDGRPVVRSHSLPESRFTPSVPIH